MNLRRLVTIGVLLTSLSLVLGAPLSATGAPGPLVIQEYTVPEETWCEIRDQWIDEIYATYPEGSWAPMKFEPTDEQLKKLGFPGRDFLLTHRFPEPTLVFPDGTMEVITLPDLPENQDGSTDQTGTAGLTSYAGAGCFGIRPGALLLTIGGGSIGWCSTAHVYGSPGSYQISTAGHCGKTGDLGTVIAGTGSRNGLTGIILLDFGKYAKSTGDGGIGNDWALLSVDAQWQRLVSPTMCFWGGPTGMYTKTGAVAAPVWGRGSIPTGVSLNPDPTLASTIMHYGHGTGLGFPAGTPRMGQVIEWRSNNYAFVGAISPGDSGSGANTVVGDTLGTAREAAGINTHLYVGTSYYKQYGLGVMAGTRATSVSATLANGQLVPYPAPLAGAP